MRKKKYNYVIVETMTHKCSRDMTVMTITDKQSEQGWQIQTS